MNALRFIEKPKNREIKISLPESFNDDLVEVVILPLQKASSEQAHSRLKIAQLYLNQSKKSFFDLGNLDAHDQ